MSRLALLLSVVVMACGDNSQTCGDGTTDHGGVCTPDPGTICGDGTTLDPSGACVVDPSVCGNGTVLINGVCQDPNGGLTIDLVEGPEPNGLEAGANPAGTIDLKPIGDPRGFVIKGCIKPVDDVADLDNFLITVQGPTLVDITADGVAGLAAGFVSITGDPAIAGWQRFGINLANDTSHREIYFPKAGTYGLVFADTRSLLGLVEGIQDLPAAGNADGSSCYYATLKQEAVPTPTVMQVPDGATGTFTNKVQFYSADMPTGFSDFVETTSSPHAIPALVMNVSGQFFKLDGAGEILTAGIKDTDTTIVAADFVVNYATQPVDYAIHFNSATTAQALATNGSITATVAGSEFSFPGLETMNQFYFDATSAGELIGMSIDSEKPLSGWLLSSSGDFADPQGAWGGFMGSKTWTTYNGLWRAPAAGRYYFVVFDPDPADTGLDFQIASVLTPVTAPAVVVGTPLTAQVANPFASNPYTIDVTGDVWDSVEAVAPTGAKVSLFDPATAYGRLGTIAMSFGPPVAGATPLATYTFPPTGGAKGFIPALMPQTSLLATVETTGTYSFAVGTRDFDTATAGSHPGETVAAGASHRYAITTAPGNHISITVHPATATDDPILETLNAIEVIVQPRNTPAGSDEILTFDQDATGVTAFDVRGVAGAAVNYDLTVTIVPVPYTYHLGTTAFSDACVGGTHVAWTGNNDEGFSSPITPPSGFQFYGASAGQFLIDTNGFLTFDLAVDTTDLSGTIYGMSQAIPDGGPVHIAPFWQDATHLVVCTRSSGTKLTVQWTGELFADGSLVQYQAILDGADSSIEFVYGPGQQANGSETNVFGTQAVAGVQNLAGDNALMTGNGNVAGFASAGHSVKITPQ